MFTVQILGNSSATPAFARFPSSQVVNFNDRYYLIDCGEGAQMQLQRYRIKYSRIDAIFISHLHGDHILGVPGLLASLSIFERNHPLPIFAPAGLLNIIETIFSQSETYLKYELEFYPLEDYEPGEVIFQTDRMSVRRIPLFHRSFCSGFLFKEKYKRRKFDFYKAKDLGIPKEYFHIIKQEVDIKLSDGRMIRADDVLLPREKTLSYAYCSDTRYEEAILPHIEKVGLLYHEATFLDELRSRAADTHHSTALQASQIAAKAEVEQLAIGHFSARYRDLGPLLDEARINFPNTELALEGRVFDLRRNTMWGGRGGPETKENN